MPFGWHGDLRDSGGCGMRMASPGFGRNRWCAAFSVIRRRACFATLLKGIHAPAHNTPMKPGSREVLLIAIAKARKWIKDVERGQSFAAIAGQEGKAERHVRVWRAHQGR